MNYHIRRFEFEDIAAFMKAYADEGSSCDPWEFGFLLQTFPQGCFVCKVKEQPVAFITSIAYGTTGWIGNLIVGKSFRGRGIGKTLTKHALESLRLAGVQSIWLSATEPGRWIYQGFGFVEVDTINQWVGFGQAGKLRDAPPGMDIERMKLLDSAYWGDNRGALIEAVCQQGKVISALDSFLVMRPWNADFVQFGPWCGRRIEIVEGLFKAALIRVGPDNPAFTFVPSRNSAAAELLAEHDFEVIASSALMCLGSAADYAPTHIFGLASPSLG